ncbi:hypothetical protein ONE63_000681 [Megalurothrips usitatus]|uniref:SEA domain-containing protein n=1 Tax=Megalurothrips usitatus TaxID=439358 RepID=A0AAV7Y584_9NEOP|nr:hypothetical protein ONE63_000681 [Megalurothrips usitatus]
MDNPGYQHDDPGAALQQRPLPGTPGSDSTMAAMGDQFQGAQPLHQPLYHALALSQERRPEQAAGVFGNPRSRSLRAPPRRPPPPVGHATNEDPTQYTLNNSRVSLASWSPGPSPSPRSATSSPANGRANAHPLPTPTSPHVRRNFISEYQHSARGGAAAVPAWPVPVTHKLHPLRNALAYPLPVPGVALLCSNNNQLQIEDGLATKKPCRCPPEEPVHEYSSILGPPLGPHDLGPHKAALAASTEPLYWSPILKRPAGGVGAGGGSGSAGPGSGVGAGGDRDPPGDEGTLKKGWCGTSRVFKYIVQRRGGAGGSGKGKAKPRLGWRWLLWLLAAALLTLVMAIGLAAYLTSGFGLLRSTEAALRSNGAVTLAGEFRVLSERWTAGLQEPRSAAWSALADRIQMQLDALFEGSALASHYRHSTVTALRPSAAPHVRDAVDVSCDVVLGDAAAVPDLVERAGLAFLRGLKHRAGRAWLGDLSVDVQSIGFVGAPISSDEEVVTAAPTAAKVDPAVPGWAPWSAWSECYWTGSRDSRGSGTMVRLRSRACALDGGRGRALDGPEPCLLRLPSAGSHFEMEACPQSQPAPGAPTAATILIQDTVVALSPAKPSVASTNTPPTAVTPTTTTARPATTSSSLSATLTSSSVITSLPSPSPSPSSSSPSVLSATKVTPTPSAEPNPSPFSMTTLLVPVIVTERPTTTSTTTAASRREPRHCDECVAGEVCVALGEEQVPRCHPVKDPQDPTGCGGHCKLNFEFCQRLDVDAFRCVDDSVCLPGEWRCGNQLCIPLVKRCDGHFNCYDHTDEHNCECNLQTHFQCGNKTSCLPKSKQCDGVVDCWDAADELNCTRTVSLTACPRQDQFTCSNGQCIPHARFCDGFSDCGDKSDEPFGCGGDCKNHEWKCGNGRCIRKRAVCNGVDDCGDHSDEKECRKSRVPGS